MEVREHPNERLLQTAILLLTVSIDQKGSHITWRSQGVSHDATFPV